MIAGKRLWVRFAFMLALFAGTCWGLVSVHAGDDTKKPVPGIGHFVLPKAFDKVAPENLQELRDIEEHVQKVLKKVMPAVVGVQVGPGSGSGVIVSEDGMILTAGHVSGAPHQNAMVIFPDGKRVKGKTLGKNGGIDSGMMKIADKGKYPFLEVGKSSELKKGQWVIAIGQPGGFRPNRTPPVRVGRILFANNFVIRTDCTLVGGDSGGPLFDMQGRVIGIHSRIGGFAITENMHVPVDTFVQTWEKLAKGDSFGGTLGQMATVQSAGGKVVFEAKGQLDKDDPTIPSPEDSAKKSHLKAFNFKMKSGSTYTIDLISGDKSGKKFDPFLRFEGPDGKMIAEDDDGGGFPHARIVHAAKKDGDYRIVATSFTANQTGAFALRILEADPPQGGKIEVLKTMKIPPAAVGALVDEFAKSKIKITLHINALLVDDKGAPLKGKEVVIQWDKGKETVKSNADGIVRWPLSKDKSRKLSFDLPKGVLARLTLTDKDGDLIPLPLEDKSGETVKSAGGPIVKTIDGVLAKGDPFDFEREKCFRHIHEFKLQAGKTYTLDLESDDFDAYLRLEDPEKAKLAEDDDAAGNLNSRIVHAAKTDGMYRIVVTTCDPGQFGAYRLTIREANGKAPPEKKKDEKK